MTVEKVICDECGRIKDHANHWHRICVLKSDEGGTVSLEIGHIMTLEAPSSVWRHAIHDLCGEACFYKHIGKLLKLNPVVSE